MLEQANSSFVTESPSAPFVLIVEDEAQIAQILEGYLRRHGFRTECVADGRSALTVHRVARPNLVLLDIQLPGVNGLDVLRRLRAEATTPVIMLTARAEDLDKLEALSSGADDYIVKPFSPLEMVARVKAVLRRTAMSQTAPSGPIRLGALEVDPQAMVVKVGRRRLNLTPAEYSILEYLARHPNRTFTRSEIIEAVIPESDALERIVDAHVGNLRRKFAAAGAPDMIETVRGSGYRLWLE
jgi:two-component system, OmpR family, response regulator AdeR